MKVALGVSAGIAAYKAAELLRVLQDQGVEVQVVMTPRAREFVTPLTFAALSGRKVIADVFGGSGDGEPNVDSAIEHIAVAQGIDALVIAPATADVIAKIAHGIADDFLTTLVLATKAPIVVAPAMNVNMWENPATQHNVEVLRQRGCKVIEPDEGYLACGMTGAGRLASVEAISKAVFETLGLRDDLNKETLLVTAGRTEEPLDPVRYLGNRSSGNMGYAVAEAGRPRGACVILVSRPTHPSAPSDVAIERVRTTEEMAEAVLGRLHQASVVVMTAAVADFRPAEVQSEKIKKERGPLTLKLDPTRDILAEISCRRRPDQFIVGFAAETNHVLENAAAKLQAKRLDLIVVNDITQAGAGFEADTNIVTLLFPDGRRRALEKMSKLEVANRVLDEVVQLRRSRPPAG